MDFLPRVLMRPLMTGLMTVPAWAEDTAVHALAPEPGDEVELDEVVELDPAVVEFVPPKPLSAVVPFPAVPPAPVSVVLVAVVPFPFPSTCLFWKLGSTNAPWSMSATSESVTESFLVSQGSPLPLLAVHPSSVYVAPSMTELYPPEIVSLVSVGMMYNCPLEMYTLFGEFVVISNSPFL